MSDNQDQLVQQQEQLEQVSATAQRLFDIRTVIGGLFAVYGVILTVTGATDSAAAVHKAQGININLWTGVAMLVVAAAFLTWQRLRPLARPADDR